MTDELTAEQILRWYVDAGVDETVGELPVDRFSASSAPAAPSSRPRDAASATASGAPRSVATVATSGPARPAAKNAAPSTQIAQACTTVEELKRAVEAYDGCALKRSCQRTVFADGNPRA